MQGGVDSHSRWIAAKVGSVVLRQSGAVPVAGRPRLRAYRRNTRLHNAVASEEDEEEQQA